MDAKQVLQLAEDVCAKHSLKFVKACAAGAFKHTFHVTSGAESLALKLIVGDIDKERIQREIGALRACSHKNISRLIAVHHEKYDGREIVCLLEEYLDGGTLADRLTGGKLLSGAECRILAIALSEALDHLSSLGIVHRDIKPENIMFRADGTPVLLDLGIARHLSATTLTQAWAAQGPGTPVYAAPEQLLNEMRLIDWRTDQFSLGVTVSIAFLGIHPFSARTDYRDVVDWVTNRRPPCAAFLAAADQKQLQFLGRMIEPWPVKRFAKPKLLINAWQGWTVK